MDVDAMLKRESQMMGRPCKYRNVWETVQSHNDQEVSVAILVYEASEPLELRYTVYVNGEQSFSGIAQ